MHRDAARGFAALFAEKLCFSVGCPKPMRLHPARGIAGIILARSVKQSFTANGAAKPQYGHLILNGYFTITVFVIVAPQIPQPSSTPAVIMYLPAGTPDKSHTTFAPAPRICPAETVYL